jgi:uncharacterized membrane protein
LRIKFGSDLIILNLLGWALILIILLLPDNVFRIILGIPFLIFFPGYTLMAALFPKKEGVSGVARVSLSFGLSVAVVALIGFALNYTVWGIRLEPILYTVASFIFLTSIIAFLRRLELTEEECFTVELYLRLPSWGESIRDRVLTIVLVLVIIGVLGTLGYVITLPRVGEAFTEFYILGQEGKAADYPKELKLGDESKVIVGIINHEGKEVDYRVELVMGSKKITEIGPVVLVDGQKWEGELGFVPVLTGERQKAEFLLYKDGEVKPYLEPLHLWVNVRE